MIQRRKFLGSIAAGFVIAGTAANGFGFQESGQPSRYGYPATPVGVRLSNELNWQCRTIDTLSHGHGSNRRQPVVTGVSIQQTGSLIAMVGDDHYICIYDLDEDRFVEHLDRHNDWVRSAKFSRDGRLLATAGNDRKLMVWNTSNWTAPNFIKTHSHAIIDLAFSNDGTRLATVGFEESLKIYDTATGDLLRTLQCACPDNHAVAFSYDGELIAAGGRNGVIRVWRAETGQLATEYLAHSQRIRSLEFGPHGRILSCGDDQVVRITSPSDALETISLPRHPSKLFAVALLGGDLVASAGSDNRIHIWNMGDTTELGVLSGHTGTVSSLDVSGATLVSGSYDTQIRIWSMERQASLEGLRTAQSESSGTMEVPAFPASNSNAFPAPEAQAPSFQTPSFQAPSFGAPESGSWSPADK